MRELVSYSCTACGGALTVDKNQEVYECPFCDNAYDFVQMHHDELLNSALYKADADRSRLMQSRNRFFDEFKVLRTKLISVENKLKLDVRPVPASD